MGPPSACPGADDLGDPRGHPRTPSPGLDDPFPEAWCVPVAPPILATSPTPGLRPFPRRDGAFAGKSGGALAGGAGGALALGPAVAQPVNRSPGFRVAALYSEEPVQKALVYLTAPDGRFFMGAEGDPLASMTDAAGRYGLARSPVGVPVVVNVLLAKQRRLVAIRVPQDGGNTLDVSMASTLVAEYLRDQANRRGKGVEAFDLAKVDHFVDLTAQMLDIGLMGAVSAELNRPDLSIPNVPGLINDYVAAIARDPELAAAWREVLGYRPLVLEAPGVDALG